jgi:hypothetical protein
MAIDLGRFVFVAIYPCRGGTCMGPGFVIISLFHGISPSISPKNQQGITPPLWRYGKRSGWKFAKANIEKL